MAKFYDWQKTMSYQTGINGEICFVLGAKGIGKTFGLRKICVDRFIKHGELFCEICRTNAERDDVSKGYFDKLQNAGYSPGGRETRIPVVLLFRVTDQFSTREETHVRDAQAVHIR